MATSRSDVDVRSSAQLLERVATVRARIAAAGGDPERVSLIVVTKGHPVEQAQLAIEAGHVDLGENYAQELLDKHAQLAARGAAAPRWHFVGRIQRNKVAKLAPHVALWHTVDRPEVGAAIARHAPGAAVLAQVNVTGEATKGGCAPSACAELVGALRAQELDVRGLMTVGPAGEPEGARAGFRTLRRLADSLGLPTCSMGMSNDLEVAVSEGSTAVRVGTALLGRRPTARHARD